MRAFAQSIVETVRHPLLVLDADLRVQRANRVFYQTYAVTPEGSDDRLLFDLGNGQWNIAPLRDLLQRVVTRGDAFDGFEVIHHFSDLGQRVMLLSARQVHHHDDNRTPMILLAVEDVTEKRRIEDELRTLNAELETRVQQRTAQLETANQEMEAFCYSVSHDLRAPLRAIDGFSQELLQSYADKLDETGQHYLRRIRAGSQRLAQLIDDMLQLSRLSRSPMRCQRVDLGALAHSVVAEFQKRDPIRQVDFEVEPDLIAWGDPGLLCVALTNLLDNAWKFTSKHERARIAVGRTRLPGQSAFFVRDDGAGFEMKFASKLFGAFQRLHTERDFPGTGIGLATMQRVIHRHGGRAWAEGAPEQGAAFYFTLPHGDIDE